MDPIEVVDDKGLGEVVPEELVAEAAGRKPQREVTLLPPRMFLSTPAPVTTWEGMLTEQPATRQTLPWRCSRAPSLGCPGRTTPSTPRFLRRPFPVTVRWTEVTTRTPRLSARRSTSARPMAPVGSPSTASSAPTEPSSTRTTSSATGGSTSTAPPPRSSTPSTTRLQQRETPLQVTDWEPTEG